MCSAGAVALSACPGDADSASEPDPTAERTTDDDAAQDNGTTTWLPMTESESIGECPDRGDATPLAWHDVALNFGRCRGGPGPDTPFSGLSLEVRNTSHATLTLVSLEVEGELRALVPPVQIAPADGAVITCHGGFPYPGDGVVGCASLALGWTDPSTGPSAVHTTRVPAPGMSIVAWDFCPAGPINDDAEPCTVVRSR